MKKLPPLLLMLLMLLLCSCTPKAEEPQPSSPSASTPAPTVPDPVTMYDPSSPLEEKSQGALKVYPLTMRKTQGIRIMGDTVLVFSGFGSTTLSALTGPDLRLTAEVTLDFGLDPQDASVRIYDDAIAFYNSESHTVLLLDQQLQEVKRIAVDMAISGSPILSEDKDTLYYCTTYAIRAWDLNTGIHRTLKELAHEEQTLSGLHCNDTIVQCTVRDGSDVQQLFLSTQTGKLCSRQSAGTTLLTEGTHYFADRNVSNLKLHLFGTSGASPQVLFPKEWNAKVIWLPDRQAAVTVSSSDDQVLLQHYQLESGLLDAEISLPPLHNPKSLESSADGSVFLLTYDPDRDCDTIYRWDPALSKTADTAVYTQPYTASLSPDALAACQTQAAHIRENYGIEILLGEDALAVQPWDYAFEPETLAAVLSRELTLLEQRLSQYPQEILDKTKSHFASLTICLVRQISGTAASGSLDTATGIQFLNGTDAYVVITTGRYAEQALYHELFHVMETHILNESAVVDHWEALNPNGFAYTYGSAPEENYALYLEDDTRFFVDSYSMTFPKEDRARVFENAMLPGKHDQFCSPALQAKLRLLCESIRDAYDLKKSPEIFPWEQYLQDPLAWSE